MPVAPTKPSAASDGAYPLTQAQSKTLAKLEQALAGQHAAILFGRSGMGTTRVLRELHDRLGGSYVTSRAFIEASTGQHPLALEETTYQLLREALEQHPAVIVDDFQFISS